MSKEGLFEAEGVVVDVYPDGYEAILLDAPIRARYRNGREAGDVEFLRPGEPTLLIIDLWSLSQTFDLGHRIGVHISSSNYPRFEVNPNTGEAPGSDKLEPRLAHNVIHHDAQHPSALVIPFSPTLPTNPLAEPAAP